MEIKLVIEVDGEYHDNPEQQTLDQLRQKALEESGYVILRFSNEQVLRHISDVLNEIRNHIAQPKKKKLSAESPPLSARRGVGGEAILIGHSMGGYIALAFAEKFPEALTAFGLFHSTAFADSEERKEKRRKGIEAIKKDGPQEFLKTFIPTMYAPETKEQQSQWIGEHIAQMRNAEGGTLVNYHEAMLQRPDRTAVLRESKVPVLFVMGKHDAAVPAEDVLKQSHLPQTASIHMLQHSGHMGMVEEAVEANKILTDFIKIVENIA